MLLWSGQLLGHVFLVARNKQASHHAWGECGALSRFQTRPAASIFRHTTRSAASTLRRKHRQTQTHTHVQLQACSDASTFSCKTFGHKHAKHVHVHVHLGNVPYPLFRFPLLRGNRMLAWFRASILYNVFLVSMRLHLLPRVSHAPPSCATCCLSQCASVLFLQRREHLHLVQRAPPYFTTCFSCTSICVLSLDANSLCLLCLLCLLWLALFCFALCRYITSTHIRKGFISIAILFNRLGPVSLSSASHGYLSLHRLRFGLRRTP